VRTRSFQHIVTSDGRILDSQLVQVMATYSFSFSHAGFDPTVANQAPSDSTLQSVIGAAWHHEVLGITLSESSVQRGGRQPLEQDGKFELLPKG
jgi:hypothetical protein